MDLPLVAGLVIGMDLDVGKLSATSSGMAWLMVIFYFKGLFDWIKLSVSKVMLLSGRSKVKLLLLAGMKLLGILIGGSLNSVVSVRLGFLKKDVVWDWGIEWAGGVNGVWECGEKEVEKGFGGLFPIIFWQKVYNFCGFRCFCDCGGMFQSISAVLNDSWVLVLLDVCVELKLWGSLLAKTDLGVVMIMPDDFSELLA